MIKIDCETSKGNIKDGVINFCINNLTDIIDTIMIFIYSDIKIKAKNDPAYSILNPDTSSLSPSAKSNGVRFVSASKQVNQINITIGEMRVIINMELLVIHCILKELIKLIIAINHKAIVTS